MIYYLYMIDKSSIAINKDIRIADTMHSDFYKKSFYYNLSIKNIFQHSWQFIIKKSELNKSIYPFYFLEDSINESFKFSSISLRKETSFSISNSFDNFFRLSS